MYISPIGYLGDVLYHEHTDRYRWDNHSDRDSNGDYNTKPDRIETKLLNRRVEDGRCKNHEGKVVNKRTAEQINNADHEHDNIAVKGQCYQPVCSVLGDVGHCYEMAKYYRSGYEHENHAGGTKCFRD